LFFHTRIRFLSLRQGLHKITTLEQTRLIFFAFFLDALISHQGKRGDIESEENKSGQQPGALEIPSQRIHETAK
jgi:hypothetical protein